MKEQLKLAINAIPTVTLSEPTATKAAIAAKIATLEERTLKGWALTRENLGEGYKASVGNFLKLKHGSHSPILGVCVDTALKGADIFQSFDISRAALNDADLRLDDLARTHSLSVEWFYDKDKSYCMRGNEKISINDALEKGLVSLNSNELRVEDAEVTLYPCVIQFSDTAMVDLRFAAPNYRNAQIVAATNQAARAGEFAWEEIAALLYPAVRFESGLGDNIYILRTYKNKVLVEANEGLGDTNSRKLYWLEYSMLRGDDNSVLVKLVGEPMEYRDEDLNEVDVLENETKHEAGHDFGPEKFAYVPDRDKPSTWKLRLCDDSGKITVEQLGRAAAAFSKGGFRGNKVQLPASVVGGVKGKIRAAYHKLGVPENEMPESIRNAKEVNTGMKLPDILNELTVEQKEAITTLIKEQLETVNAEENTAINDALEAYKNGEGAKLLADSIAQAREQESLVYSRFAELNSIVPVPNEEREATIKLLRETNADKYEALKANRERDLYKAKVDKLETNNTNVDNKTDDKDSVKSTNTADPAGPGLGKGKSEEEEIRIL